MQSSVDVISLIRSDQKKSSAFDRLCLYVRSRERAYRKASVQLFKCNQLLWLWYDVSASECEEKERSNGQNGIRVRYKRSVPPPAARFSSGMEWSKHTRTQSIIRNVLVTGEPKYAHRKEVYVAASATSKSGWYSHSVHMHRRIVFVCSRMHVFILYSCMHAYIRERVMCDKSRRRRAVGKKADFSLDTHVTHT